MKTLKLVSLALGLLFVGCGDDVSLPDCDDLVQAQLCADPNIAICLSSVAPVCDGAPATFKPAVGCIAWHRPIADQPLVPTLCSASCQ